MYFCNEYRIRGYCDKISHGKMILQAGYYNDTPNPFPLMTLPHPPQLIMKECIDQYLRTISAT